MVRNVAVNSVCLWQMLYTDLYEAIKGKGKGKAIPLLALTGPEGGRKLRLPDFKTIGI